MKVNHLVLTKIACLALLTASALPVFGKSQPKPVIVAASDDTTAILNLVRGWGAVGDILIVNNYASLSLFYGQNGGKVTFKRKNGRWTIIDGGRRQGGCLHINCLVNKGVSRDIATQLFNYLETSDKRRDSQLNYFQQAWYEKNKNITYFLGYWMNQGWPDTKEIAISFWPSFTPNKVCIIGISENSQYVKTGAVSGNSIKFDNRTFILSRNNENFVDFISSSDKKYFLINLSKLNTWYFNTATKQKLRDAGCTASLLSR